MICPEPNDPQEFEYRDFLRQIRENIAAIKGPVFRTRNAKHAADVFLAGIPEEYRQHYNCHACKTFLRKYGSLVTLSETGTPSLAIWPMSALAGRFFRDALGNLANHVEHSIVDGVFVSPLPVWGTPDPDPWHHMSGKAPNHLVYTGIVKKAHEVAAEQTQGYIMLQRYLSETTEEQIQNVLRVLGSDEAHRSEKVFPHAGWFLNLLYKVNHPAWDRNNTVWLAVATAPAGWAHVGGTMLGSVLDDVKAGYPFADLVRRYNAKMGGLDYQRPKAAPKIGNIEQAEKIVKQLGIEKSLQRRFARMEDLRPIWTPTQAEPIAYDGVFGVLRNAQKSVNMNVPAKTMTWVKFEREVLPTARMIEFWTPPRGNYASLVAPVHLAAPNILQWEPPISSYVYYGGSLAGDWNLLPNTWTAVKALVLSPWMWEGRIKNNPRGVFFILDGAKDNRTSTSSCIFPEILKSELHSIRATIEAYSNKTPMQGREKQNAGAYGAVEGQTWSDIRLKVDGQEYRLDRWD